MQKENLFKKLKITGLLVTFITIFALLMVNVYAENVTIDSIGGNNTAINGNYGDWWLPGATNSSHVVGWRFSVYESDGTNASSLRKKQKWDSNSGGMVTSSSIDVWKDNYDSTAYTLSYGKWDHISVKNSWDAWWKGRQDTLTTFGNQGIYDFSNGSGFADPSRLFSDTQITEDNVNQFVIDNSRTILKKCVNNEAAERNKKLTTYIVAEPIFHYNNKVTGANVNATVAELCVMLKTSTKTDSTSLSWNRRFSTGALAGFWRTENDYPGFPLGVSAYMASSTFNNLKSNDPGFTVSYCTGMGTYIYGTETETETKNSYQVNYILEGGSWLNADGTEYSGVNWADDSTYNRRYGYNFMQSTSNSYDYYIPNSNPTRAGYTFKGWAIFNTGNPVIQVVNNDGSWGWYNVADWEKTQSGNWWRGYANSRMNLLNGYSNSVYLVAQWEKSNGYQVNYILEGGDWLNADGTNYNGVGWAYDPTYNRWYAYNYMERTGSDYDYPIPNSNPTRTGYVFKGWAIFDTGSTVVNIVGSDGNWAEYNVADLGKTESGNWWRGYANSGIKLLNGYDNTIYLIAQWERHFQIDYNLDGGNWDNCKDTEMNFDNGGWGVVHPWKSFSSNNDSYNYTIPADNPTREGYKFMGWKVTGGTLYYHYDSNNPNSVWLASDTENTNLRFFADSGRILELRTEYISLEAQWEQQEKVTFFANDDPDPYKAWRNFETKYIDKGTWDTYISDLRQDKNAPWTQNYTYHWDYTDSNDTYNRAVYCKKKITIKYDLNGASSDSTFDDKIYTSYDQPYYADHTLPSTIPTREGYIFTGWKLTKGQIAYWQETDKDTHAGRVQFFNENDKSITYHDSTGTHTVNSKLDGCDWIGDVIFTYQPSQSMFPSSSKATLQAQWILAKYDISYDLNGGSLPTDVTNPDSYTIETPTFTLNNPTKDGYEFIGWTGSNGTTPQKEVIIEQGTTGDKEYKANWTPIISQVTLKNNDGTDKVNGYYYYHYNTKYSFDGKTYFYFAKKDSNGNYIQPDKRSNLLTSQYVITSIAIPTRTGYTFEGYFGASGTQYVSKNGTPINSLYTKFSKDITLYAKWTPNSYTIKFDKNATDATGTMNNMSMTFDVAQNLTANAFARVGYTFTGWSTTSTGSISYSDKSSVKNLTLTNGDTVTLYAQWEKTPVAQLYFAKTNEVGKLLDGAEFTFYTDEDCKNIFKSESGKNITVKSGTYTSPYSGVISSSNSAFSSTGMVALLNINSSRATNRYDYLYFKETTPPAGYETNNTIYKVDLRNGGKISTIQYKDSTGTFKNVQKTVGEMICGTDESLGFSGKCSKIINNANTITVTLDKQKGTGGLDNYYYKYQTPQKFDGTTYYYFSSTTMDSTTKLGPTNIGSSNLPTRTGYTFNGYYSKANGEGTCYVTSAGAFTNDLIGTNSSDITLYANWTPIDYDISYDLNGGSLPPDKTNPDSYTIETPTFTLNNPTKDGYEFIGWTGSNGIIPQKEITIEQGTMGEKKYTANWVSSLDIKSTVDGVEKDDLDHKAEIVLIKINGIDMGVIDPNDYTATLKENTTYEITIKAKEGYVFDDNGKTETTYTGTFDGNKVINQKILTVFNIDYDLDGGLLPTDKTNPDSYTIETPTFTLNNPTKDGYEFIGWTEENNDEKIIEKTIVQGSTGDKKFTANWEVVKEEAPPYTVHFDKNNDYATGYMNDQQIKTDKNETLYPNRFTCEHAQFIGWSKSRNAQTPDYHDKQAVINIAESDKTITLYAVWSYETYNIVFNGNKGSIQESNSTQYSQEAKYGSTTKLQGNKFSYGDQRFMGWNTSPDGTGTKYNNYDLFFKGLDSDLEKDDNGNTKNSTVTLYAQWSKTKITLDSYSYFFDKFIVNI